MKQLVYVPDAREGDRAIDTVPALRARRTRATTMHHAARTRRHLAHLPRADHVAIDAEGLVHRLEGGTHGAVVVVFIVRRCGGKEVVRITRRDEEALDDLQ